MAPPAGEKETRYLKSVMLERPDSLLFARLADVYRKEGDIDQAIELCINGLNTYPYYNTGRILLGRCYLEQQKTAEAIQAFTMVCAADRRNQVAIKMLADIFARQGMDRKAGDLYALLLSMDPEQPSLRQLCSRYETSGTEDLFSILGLQATPVAEAAPPPVSEMSMEPSEAVPEGTFIEQEQISSDAYTQSDGGFAQPESLDTVRKSFGEMTEAGPDVSAADISGSDISDRMSMLFDEQTEQGEQTGGSDSLGQVDFGDSAFNEILTPDGNDDVSGSDISNRIEELFSDGTDGNNIGADVLSREEVVDAVDDAGIPDAPTFDEPAVQDTDGMQTDTAASDISGSDISDRLGELFGEESVPLEQVGEPASASFVQAESDSFGSEDGFDHSSGSEDFSQDGMDQMFFSDSTDTPEAVEDGGAALQNIDLSLDSFGIQEDPGTDEIIPDLPDMDLSAFEGTGPEVLPIGGGADSAEEFATTEEAAQDTPADDAMQFTETSAGGEVDVDSGSITELSADDEDNSDITGDDVLNRLSAAFDEPESFSPTSPVEAMTSEEEAVSAFDPDIITLDSAEAADEHALFEENTLSADTDGGDITPDELDADIFLAGSGQAEEPVVTGEDVADRLGMVFDDPDVKSDGESREAQPVAVGESPEQFATDPVASDTGVESDEMFADESILTGSDMEERLATLFSDEEPASDAPVFAAEDENSDAQELPETSFSDPGLSDEMVDEPGLPAAEEMTDNGVSDDAIVTGNDMEEHIATLFSDDLSVQTPEEGYSATASAIDEQPPETDLPVMAFPDEEAGEPSSVEGADYDGATVTDVSLVTGSDMEARIDSLFPDPPPEQHERVEPVFQEEEQVDQWQNSESDREPDVEENGVSGDDVSDRIDMVFNQGLPNTTAPESVEILPTENNDDFSLQQESVNQDHFETPADRSSASLAEASDTFFAEKFSSKLEAEGLVPDEELVEPDFEETMQFDSALFEEMLHPTDQSAPFMQDEQDSVIPHIDTSDTLVKDDTSLSSESVQKPLQPEAQALTSQPPDSQSEIPQLILDEDQEIDLTSEFSSMNEPELMRDDFTFEVTTRQPGEEVTDLIADAPSEDVRLDKTAVFEVNVSETQTDLVIDADADDGEDRRDEVVDELLMPSGHLVLPPAAETGDHTEAVDFFEDAVEVADTVDEAGSVATADTPVADDTFAGVVLVDSNEPDPMDVPSPAVPELQRADEDFVPEDITAPAVAMLPAGETGIRLTDDGYENMDGESPEISGDDVEQRLSAMFQSDDLMSLSSDGLQPPEDEQEEVMDRVADFYTISGENAEQGTQGELPDTLSDVEFDAESSIADGATVEIPLEAVRGAVADGEAFTDKTDEILPDVELFEEVASNDDTFAEETIAFDRRDRPFDIPDHVLTPTLADIYYQQGQHQLALEIYTRLADRDPDNEKLTERIAGIREILSTANEGGEREKEPVRPSGSKPKKKTSAHLPVEDPRPLAGVRIKKKVKNARKNTRKRS